MTIDEEEMMQALLTELFVNCPFVQRTPGRLSGALAMVSSPRVPVDGLITNFDAGHSIEEVAEMYRADVEDVRGIIQHWVAWQPPQPKTKPSVKATSHYKRLIAAGHAADKNFGEDLSHLTPQQMVAKLYETSR